MKGLVGFFTRIPVKGEVDSALRWIFLLPLLSFITSAIPMFFLYISHPLSPVLALVSLYLVIGIIHLDGLGDFFDGLMVYGDAREKLRAMKSPEVGVAGIFAIFTVLAVQLYSLSLIPFYYILISEMNSKLSMIILLFAGKPSHDGIGSIFMNGVDLRDITSAVVIYMAMMTALGMIDSRALLSILSLLTPLYILKKSNENFGGVNGDCIGANAELTRAISLLILGFAIRL